MKKFLILGALAAILAFGGFDIAWATHTISGISPATGAPGATIPATITGTGFTVGFCGSNQPAGITVTSCGATSATQIALNFIIAPSAATGSRTFNITLGGHSVDVTFTVGVGAGPGPGTGPGGGGFVEEVPARFGPIPEGPQTGEGFISVVEGITNWIFVILLVFAVIFILLAAFQFIAGGGDPQAVAQARGKLIWAAVGVAVALLARGIPTAIGNLIL